MKRATSIGWFASLAGLLGYRLHLKGPAELADDLAGMAFLNDAALWRIARGTLAADHHRQMDDLLDRKGRGELMPAEQLTLDRLLLEYQAQALRRGQAAALLQRRGYDMADPIVLNRLPCAALTFPLFNPRTQNWQEHFMWSRDGTQVIGLTPTGRATVLALQINSSLRVLARQRWVLTGRHPPRD